MRMLFQKTCLSYCTSETLTHFLPVRYVRALMDLIVTEGNVFH